MMDDKSRTDSITVLVLATTFPRWKGDWVPRFVYDLAKQFQDNDLEVVVLAPHDPGAKRRETMSGVKVYRYPYFVPYRYQKVVFEGGVLATVKQSPVALLQVPFLLSSLLLHGMWLLRKEDVDVIHSHWVVPNGVIGGLLSSVFHVPHVLTLHAGGVLGLQGAPLNTQVANFVYKRSDAIVPVSTNIRDSFQEILGLNGTSTDEKFTIQPMGAHTGDFDISNKTSLREKWDVEDEIIGLYVGRLAEKKGLFYLIDAVEDLKTEHKNFRMVIVGTGKLEKELNEYTAEKGLEDYVELTGWISEEELHERYVLSDFVVVPSIEMDDGDTEGMPTVIAEAFASANPVIASEVGGISDVVKHKENGYLIEQKQPEKLASTMKVLINNEDVREELTKGAIESASALDWGQCGETYAKIIKSSYETNNNSRYR